MVCCHWQLSGDVPVTVTSKAALRPRKIVPLVGWVTMVGGPSTTVIMAGELVALPSTLVKTTV